MAVDPSASAPPVIPPAVSPPPVATSAQAAAVGQMLGGNAIPPREPPSLFMKIFMPIGIAPRLVFAVIALPVLVAISPIYLPAWSLAAPIKDGVEDLFSPFTDQLRGIKANIQGYSLDEYDEMVTAEKEALNELLNPPPPAAPAAAAGAPPPAAVAAPMAADGAPPPAAAVDLDDKPQILTEINTCPTPRFAQIINHWNTKEDDEIETAIKKRINDMTVAERQKFFKDLAPEIKAKYE